MHCQLEKKHEVYIWLKNNQICLICDESSETAHSICNTCETELPWLMDQCEVCALPLPMSGLVCGQCLKRPPAFKQVVAPWIYSFPIDSLISRFKHQARWPLGHLLAHLLGQMAQRPAGLMLETADQAVDGKAEGPGCNHLFKRRRSLQALAAYQACHGQGQCTHFALIHQPGQLGFADVADGMGCFAAFIAD